MTDTHHRPAAGGSYIRDPKTGRLARQQGTAARPAPGTEPAPAPAKTVAKTPAKPPSKGTEK